MMYLQPTGHWQRLSSALTIIEPMIRLSMIVYFRVLRQAVDQSGRRRLYRLGRNRSRAGIRADAGLGSCSWRDSSRSVAMLKPCMVLAVCRSLVLDLGRRPS